MSYAVIQTGGKQYKVKSGEILKVEKPFLMPLNVWVFISTYKRNTPKRITKK